MRVIAIADTHLFHEDLGELPAGDVLVHAGDLCRGGGLDELAEAAAWLRSLPYRHKLVIAGNHEVCLEAEPEAARRLLADFVYLQDSGVTLEGVRFWGTPWQPAFHDWAFNLPRGEALAARWALIPDGVDFLITHGPPRGFGDRLPDGLRAGCDDLLVAARRVRPLIQVFGHIHGDGGVWLDPESGVTFANVTTFECERGATVVDVDVVARRVVVTAPARDEVTSGRA